MDSIASKVSNQLSETEKREGALNFENIMKVLVPEKCANSRKDLYKCRGNCYDKFGSITNAVEAVFSLRKLFWKGPDFFVEKQISRHEYHTGRNVRNCLLIAHLFEKSITEDLDDNNRSIVFRMGKDVRVCKSFFQKATGINHKCFDEACSYVMNYHVIDRPPSKFDNVINSELFKKLCGETFAKINQNYVLKSLKAKSLNKDLKVAQVLSFLDLYFSKNIDCSPDEGGVKFARENWLDIYAQYCESCVLLEVAPMAYNTFVGIRRMHRPNYRKHRELKSGGWNHLACATCSKLRRQIRSEKDDDKRRKLESELQYHNERASTARQKYYATRTKAIKNIAKGDCSMIVDAAGGTGTTYSPRMRTTEKNEPARHTMLKIKSTFVKVHGVGSLICLSLPDMERQGANLTFESILQGIILYKERTGAEKIRNLYIQLDNTSSNKGYSLMAAISSLVKLGICKKVKVSYLEVGHTHEDIDALIGVIVEVLRKKDVATFEEFTRYVKEAVKNMEGSVKVVVELLGITDYHALFDGVIPSDISGITKVKEIRVTADADNKICVYYKRHTVDEGWLPKPIAEHDSFDHIKHLFHASEAGIGAPVRLVGTPTPGVEHGQRQHWIYKVGYANGTVVDVPVKCISLPVNFDHCDGGGMILEWIEGNARPQIFDGALSCPDKRETILGNIKALLKARNLDDKILWWDDYFEKLNLKLEFTNTLHNVAMMCGGNIIPSIYTSNTYDHRIPDELVQPVTFTGGPIKNQAARRRLLEKVVNGNIEKEIENEKSKRKSKENATKKKKLSHIVNECDDITRIKSKRSKMDDNITTTKKSKKKTVDSDSEDEDVYVDDLQTDSDDLSEPEEDQYPISYNQNKADTNDEDIAAFMYLVNTTHYDNDDNAVYKVVRVEEATYDGDSYIVGFRDLYNPETGKYVEDEGGAVHIKDIIKYHEDIQLQAVKDRILSGKNRTKQTKQKVSEGNMVKGMTGSSGNQVNNRDNKDDSGKDISDNCVGKFRELDDFMYLVGTTHYDPDEDAVFKVVRVVEEEYDGEVYIVAFRQKYVPATEKWITEHGGSINIGDVLSYYEDKKLNEMKNRILTAKSVKKSKKSHKM